MSGGEEILIQLRLDKLREVDRLIAQNMRNVRQSEELTKEQKKAFLEQARQQRAEVRAQRDTLELRKRVSSLSGRDEADSLFTQTGKKLNDLREKSESAARFLSTSAGGGLSLGGLGALVTSAGGAAAGVFALAIEVVEPLVGKLMEVVERRQQLFIQAELAGIRSGIERDRRLAEFNERVKADPDFARKQAQRAWEADRQDVLLQGSGYSSDPVEDLFQ